GLFNRMSGPGTIALATAWVKRIRSIKFFILKETQMASRLGTLGHQAVWRFSNKEIVYVVTGSFFYAVLFWILKTWPVSFPVGNLTLSVSFAIAIPIFLGLLFGPIVGGLTGLIGQALGGIVSASGFSWP